MQRKTIIIIRRRRKETLCSYHFNRFMHDHTFHHGRKYFCCYSLQAFNIEEILNHHIKKIALKLMANKGL